MVFKLFLLSYYIGDILRDYVKQLLVSLEDYF